MKKFGLIIIVSISLFIASCVNKSNNSSNNQGSSSTNQEAVSDKKTTSPVQRPKDLEPLKDGKRVVVAKPKSSNHNDNDLKNLTLDKAIIFFRDEVNAAKNCQELMTACRSFDENVKKLSNKDKSITISSVEQRQDVRDIRKISEEKSLNMCQTQKLVK